MLLDRLGLAHLMQKIPTLSVQAFEFATMALQNLAYIAIQPSERIMRI